MYMYNIVQYLTNYDLAYALLSKEWKRIYSYKFQRNKIKAYP